MFGYKLSSGFDETYTNCSSILLKRRSSWLEFRVTSSKLKVKYAFVSEMGLIGKGNEGLISTFGTYPCLKTSRDVCVHMLLNKK